jgi:hypothetical protein
MYPITQGRTVTEISAHRRRQRRGVGSRAAKIQLRGDGLAHVLGLQLCEHHRSVGELIPQQALYQTQGAAACPLAEPAGLTQVRVVSI